MKLSEKQICELIEQLKEISEQQTEILKELDLILCQNQKYQQSILDQSQIELRLSEGTTGINP